MQAIITMILPIILKTLGYFIDKGIKDAEKQKEAREAYIGFIRKIENSFTDSARLRKSAKSQIEWLKNRDKDA